MADDDNEHTYSWTRLKVSGAGSIAAVALLFYLVVAQQLAVAIVPVVGIGGVYLQADEFRGDKGLIYPEEVETAECEQRPVIVIDFQDAKIQGMSAYKDIKLPHLTDRWMTVQLTQPSTASVRGTDAKIYASEFSADFLRAWNSRVSEGGGWTNYGPGSDEFLLEADPNDNTFPDLKALNMEAWVHKITVGNLRMFGGSGDVRTVSINITFPTTSELRSDRSTALMHNNFNREGYFDCLPRPPGDGTYLNEEFAGCDLLYDFDSNSKNLLVNDNKVDQSDDETWECSAQLNGTDSVLEQDPGKAIDLSGASEVPFTYWVHEGGDDYSEGPDSGEFIYVEYINENGRWKTLDIFEGQNENNNVGRLYDTGTVLPQDAYHTDFRVRFRTEGGGSTFDHWHVDDIEVG